MSTVDSTEAVEVKEVDDLHESPQETEAWWFRARGRIIAPRPRTTPANPVSEQSGNRTGDSTADSPTTVDVSQLKPIARQRPFFGRRGFVPVYQWEGVVEEVNGESFRARLRPFEGGEADRSQIEYADFEYDDLADESDRDLVANGAIFYWTVGKSRNAAGTLFNTSLLRFRRLPSPTPAQAQEAARAAGVLLADLDHSR